MIMTTSRVEIDVKTMDRASNSKPVKVIDINPELASKNYKRNAVKKLELRPSNQKRININI